MTNTIYVDVLILINIYIGYFFIAATKKIMNASISKKRIFLGCIVCGLSSLVIFLSMNIVESIIVKSSIFLAISFIVFYKRGANNRAFFVKSMFCFFIVGLIFGGFMMFIYFLAAPPFMRYRNGILYFNISALSLAVTTVISYLVISVLCCILNKRGAKSSFYTVDIFNNNSKATITSFLDSGNKLVDIFTGAPIMVAELNSIKAVLPEALYDFIHNFYVNYKNDESFCEFSNDFIDYKLKIVPISVVSGTSSMIVFKPDKLLLNKRECNALVAVTQQALSDGEFHGLVCEAMLL